MVDTKAFQVRWYNFAPVICRVL